MAESDRECSLRTRNPHSHGKLSTATEKQLRQSEGFSPKTEQELTEYIHALVDRKHDYGTCVYAMSLSAYATFNYVAHVLGVTGFQAGCADLDFLMRTRGMKLGFHVSNYENLLYPQYFNDPKDFPNAQLLLRQNLKNLRKEARKLLRKEGASRLVHPDVLAHWKMIASMREEASV